MNPHTDQTSSTRKKDSALTKELDGVSVKVKKQSAHAAGGGSSLVKPEQIQKIKTPLIATLVLLAVVDIFVHGDHATFIWDSIPGFNAVYGLITTVLIIVVSKALGHALLMKPEDYYD